MAKQAGLGDNLYVGGYDLSGDIGSLGRIGGGPAAMPVTGIDKSAYERIGGVRDGAIEFNAYFNPATNRAHDRLGNLPTSDVQIHYCRGTTVGAPGAALIAKQVGYDGNRGSDGSFRFAVQAVANGYGLEWGRQLTAGKRTDSTATNGASIDTTASAAFGAQAYLQVFAFTGTSVTVAIQDSADDSSFANVTGLTFTAATGITTERLATANNATIRRYLRAVTTGTFSDAVFSVIVVKNEIAGQVF
jgi:hypothetical protein